MNDVDSLRRQVRVLQAGLLALTAGLVIAATSGSRDVITAHRLIIVDHDGRQRIVLGSGFVA